MMRAKSQCFAAMAMGVLISVSAHAGLEIISNADPALTEQLSKISPIELPGLDPARPPSGGNTGGNSGTTTLITYQDLKVGLKVNEIDFQANVIPFDGINVGDIVDIDTMYWGGKNVTKMVISQSAMYFNAINDMDVIWGDQTITMPKDGNATIGFTNNRSYEDGGVYDHLRYGGVVQIDNHDYRMEIHLYADKDLFDAIPEKLTDIADVYANNFEFGIAELHAYSNVMPGVYPADSPAYKDDVVKFDVVSLNGVTIPEPGMLAMGLAGLGLLGFRRKR
ncbi:PEP-CTERM sorting domain-containing protein [Planctomycetota bacterium]|nr:PEP-CTERM sorting domain-containing protein [Planctomycetota bacterium]